MSKDRNPLHSKAHQVTNLMTEFGMSRTQATGIIEAVMHDIERAVQEGRDVRLPGVGTLYVKEVAARNRRNPITGELFHADAHRTIAFRRSKAGQDRLNGKA